MTTFPRTVMIVGSLNMDFIVRSSRELTGLKHQRHKAGYHLPGGHGGNQAVAVYRASHCERQASDSQAFDHPSCDDSCGTSISESLSPVDSIDFEVNVCITGKVGSKGEHGELIKRELTRNGVDILQVTTAADVETGYAHIKVSPAGVPEVDTVEGANEHLTPEDIQTWPPSTALVLVQLEIPIETVRAVIKQAKLLQIPVIFNPAPYDPIIREDTSLFEVAHLIVNSNIADQILQLEKRDKKGDLTYYAQRTEIERRYLDACYQFHMLGASYVVITLGSLGAVASYLEESEREGRGNPKRWTIPAKEAQFTGGIIDETGASDAFIGAYAVEILRQSFSSSTSHSEHKGLDIDAAVEAGIKAGALAITKLGSMNAMPWRNEICAPKKFFKPAEGSEFP